MVLCFGQVWSALGTVISWVFCQRPSEIFLPPLQAVSWDQDNELLNKTQIAVENHPTGSDSDDAGCFFVSHSGNAYESPGT